MTKKLYNQMSTVRLIAMMFICALFLTACGSDGGSGNDDDNKTEQKNNVNQNPASGYDTNKKSLNAAQRMEFPGINKPKGNYYVIVHTVSGVGNQYSYAGKTYPYDADGINFCTIWDKDKK